MTIGVGAAINHFGTRAAIHDGVTQAVVDGAYSNDALSWVNTDDVQSVSMAFIWSWLTASGTLSANPSISVFARLMAVDGSGNDASIPDDNYQEIFIGTITLDGALAAETVQYTPAVALPLPLLNTQQEIQFYFKNNTGVTVNAGWDWDAAPNAPAVKTA